MKPAEQMVWDMFAANALNGLLAAEVEETPWPSREQCVNTACDYADLMMTERAKRLEERK